jgi:N-acetylmuramoyl-L-alanine amidase
MTKRIVMLDPGHGGKDPGAVGNGLREKDLVLNICQRVKNYMEMRYEVDCKLTRDDDRFIDLSRRTTMARGYGAEALVSVHINSATVNTANGFESFIHPDDLTNSPSAQLQNVVHRHLAKVWTDANRRDRGKKAANFHMVREFKPAVLVELGFIVNDVDASLLKRSGFLQLNAEALANGIAEHMKLKPKSAKPSSGNVYRVRVDGKQVGAFAEPENVARAVAKAVSAGKERVEVALIK